MCISGNATIQNFHYIFLLEARPFSLRAEVFFLTLKNVDLFWEMTFEPLFNLFCKQDFFFLSIFGQTYFKWILKALSAREKISDLYHFRKLISRLFDFSHNFFPTFFWKCERKKLFATKYFERKINQNKKINISSYFFRTISIKIRLLSFKRIWEIRPWPVSFSGV